MSAVEHEDMPAKLTDDELALLGRLADVWNGFLALPSRQSDETGAFWTGIHDLQRIVMARLARRTHPEFFR